MTLIADDATFKTVEGRDAKSSKHFYSPAHLLCIISTVKQTKTIKLSGVSVLTGLEVVLVQELNTAVTTWPLQLENTKTLKYLI